MLALRKYFLLYLLLCTVSLVKAQEKLTAILNNQLISISGNDASYDVLASLSDTIGEDLANMVYSVEDKLYYAILKPRQSPTLITIDKDGIIDIKGPVSVTNKTVYMVEGLGYNENDHMLYVAASLNGGPSTGDYNSESILKVNPVNGAAEVITVITTDAPNGTDVDKLAFWHDTIYLLDDDLRPITNVYRFTVPNVPKSISPEKVFSENRYFGVGDMCVVNDSMYFTNNHIIPIRGLYKFDLTRSPLTYDTIGITHAVDSGHPIFCLSAQMETSASNEDFSHAKPCLHSTPNPVSDILKIELQQEFKEAQILVINSLGQTLNEARIEEGDKLEIRMDSYAIGVYHLVCITDLGTYNQKIVVYDK